MDSWRNEAILGAVLIVLGLLILTANLDFMHVGGAVLGLVFFGGVGFVFFKVYKSSAENWWAAIPAGALFGLAAVSVLESIEGTPPGVSGAAFLWASSLPFIILFRREPRFFWTSIPAGFLGILGLLALVSGTAVGGALFALLLYWGIGLTFGIVFLRRPERWWPVIPAGVFFSLGIVELLERARLGGPSFQAFLFCLGLAATFGFLFVIRNEENKLGWAKIPAVVLLLISLLFLFSALSWGVLVKVVSVLLVLAGLYLIFSSRRSAGRDQT